MGDRAITSVEVNSEVLTWKEDRSVKTLSVFQNSLIRITLNLPLGSLLRSMRNVLHKWMDISACLQLLFFNLFQGGTRKRYFDGGTRTKVLYHSRESWLMIMSMIGWSILSRETDLIWTKILRRNTHRASFILLKNMQIDHERDGESR